MKISVCIFKMDENKVDILNTTRDKVVLTFSNIFDGNCASNIIGKLCYFKYIAINRLSGVISRNLRHRYIQPVRVNHTDLNVEIMTVEASNYKFMIFYRDIFSPVTTAVVARRRTGRPRYYS